MINTFYEASTIWTHVPIYSLSTVAETYLTQSSNFLVKCTVLSCGENHQPGSAVATEGW